MRDFVLDESAFIRALYAEHTQRDDDLMAARLLQCLQLEHRWVLSVAILKAYHRQFDKHVGVRERGRIASALMRSLRDVLRGVGAHRFVYDPPSIPGAYDHDDDHIVGAAAAVSGCIVVTLDRRLKDCLTAAGIASKHGFDVLDVNDALRLLCGGAVSVPASP